MARSRAIVKIAACYLLMLAAAIPICYGFKHLTVLQTASSTAIGFTLNIGLYWVLNRRGESAGSNDLNRYLIYGICFSSTAIILPSSLAAFNYTFGAGMFEAILSGKLARTSVYYPSRSIVAVSMLGALFILSIFRIIGHEDATISQLLFYWFGPSLTFLLGQRFGILLNRCVPPLIDAWYEVKRLGRALGGYAFGYAVISVVFAGCYASLLRLDKVCMKGINSQQGFFDYWYYSISIMTTMFDPSPTTWLAKAAVALEVLAGVAWTVVVFAAVLAVSGKTAKTPVDKGEENMEVQTKAAPSQE